MYNGACIINGTACVKGSTVYLEEITPWIKDNNIKHLFLWCWLLLISNWGLFDGSYEHFYIATFISFDQSAVHLQMTPQSATWPPAGFHSEAGGVQTR